METEEARVKFCLVKLLCVFGRPCLAIELNSLLLPLLFFLFFLLLNLRFSLLRWSLPLVKPLTQRPDMPLDQVTHLKVIWIWSPGILDRLRHLKPAECKDELEDEQAWKVVQYVPLLNLL